MTTGATKINITIDEHGRPGVYLTDGTRLEGVERIRLDIDHSGVVAEMRFWLPPHEFKNIKARVTTEHLRELAGQGLYFSLTLRKGEAAPIRSAVISTVGVIVIVRLSTYVGS